MDPIEQAPDDLDYTFRACPGCGRIQSLNSYDSMETDDEESCREVLGIEDDDEWRDDGLCVPVLICTRCAAMFPVDESQPWQQTRCPLYEDEDEDEDDHP